MLQRINLVPGFSATDHLRRLMPLLLVGALLLIVVVLSGEYWWRQRQSALLAKEITALETATNQSEELQKSILQLTSQIKSMRNQVDQTTDQANRLTGHISMKQNFSDILADIGQALPPSLRCEKITINHEGGSIEGLAVHYRELPQLANKLRRNPRFATVMITEIDQSGERADSPFRFFITFQLQSKKQPPVLPRSGD